MAFPDEIDAIPDMGPTLADPPHTDIHNRVRDQAAQVATWVLSQINAIKANSWVTTARIANGAVTDAKLATGISVSKLSGTLFPGAIRSPSTIQADTFMRAGSGSGNPAWAIQRYGGTLDGSGNAIVAHNIANAGARVLFAQAWAITGDGGRLQLNVWSVDAGSFYLTNKSGLPAQPGAAWHGAILYTEDAA